MIEKCRGIVVQTIPHTGNAHIVHILTAEYGRLPFYHRISRSRKATISPAHLLPLSIIDLEMDYRNDAHFQKLMDVRCNPMLPDIQQNPAKAAIALFIQEILVKMMPEGLVNKALYAFIETAIQGLEHTQAGFRHFPPYFLLHTIRYMGYSQQAEYAASLRFQQMQEPESPYLLGVDEYCTTLAACSIENIDLLNFDQKTARNALNVLLNDLKVHHTEAGKIQSHRILSEVF